MAIVVVLAVLGRFSFSIFHFPFLIFHLGSLIAVESNSRVSRRYRVPVLTSCPSLGHWIIAANSAPGAAPAGTSNTWWRE